MPTEVTSNKEVCSSLIWYSQRDGPSDQSLVSMTAEWDHNLWWQCYICPLRFLLFALWSGVFLLPAKVVDVGYCPLDQSPQQMRFPPNRRYTDEGQHSLMPVASPLVSCFCKQQTVQALKEDAVDTPELKHRHQCCQWAKAVQAVLEFKAEHVAGNTCRSNINQWADKAWWKIFVFEGRGTNFYYCMRDL